MNIVGENVARLRKQMKLSQRELSERLELYAVYICRGSISRIEDCSRTVTDIEIDALAKVLKVKVEDLFEKR